MNLLAQTATGRWQPGMSAAWFHLPRRQQFHLALVLIGGLGILLDVLPIWSQATIWAALVLIQVARCRAVCAAGAIAEEKDRRTLDYLLASDLSNAEIVFGKLLSRLAYLALIMLTGLPFLSLLQLLGGVDPSLVVVGLVVTLMTMLSLA